MGEGEDRGVGRRRGNDVVDHALASSRAILDEIACPVGRSASV